ncbi:hypothetical protein CRG98_050155 [Punica granatum]|uniref:Uncharacterized protein n=1 Tax=Punica granatum TaxID=22663 RepID=A0A2I0GRJ8_PUNGR|nr:hypothetical protein CRG98_050155 [Punica granatum]
MFAMILPDYPNVTSGIRSSSRAAFTDDDDDDDDEEEEAERGRGDSEDSASSLGIVEEGISSERTVSRQMSHLVPESMLNLERLRDCLEMEFG